MTANYRHPRILVIAPGVTTASSKIKPSQFYISARSGGMGDICTAQVHELYERGVDIHLAIPGFKNIPRIDDKDSPDLNIHHRRHQLPMKFIHRVNDSCFHYHPKLYLAGDQQDVDISLAFQREVISHVLPEVKPDFIYCHDWMTGLIPAVARLENIPCLFTICQPGSPKVLLSTIEDQGLDMKLYWRNCYYSRIPTNFEETKNTNALELLTTGVLSANFVNTLSHTVLRSFIDENNTSISPSLTLELQKKYGQGRFCVLPAIPDASFNPATDRSLFRVYGPGTHSSGKPYNKLHLQENLDLKIDSTVPMLFCPTPLYWGHPECRIILDTLGTILEHYWEQGLQIVFIAEGDFHEHLRLLTDQLRAADRVAVCDFDAHLYRLAYGGSDFLLIPAYFAPNAIPCIIAQWYGTLPIAYDTGAIHDCIIPLNETADVGTGFLYRHYDSNGLLWAIEQALNFFNQPSDIKKRQVQRIMSDSLSRFRFEDTTRQAIEIYLNMLNQLPLL